jgi:GNAT superfamily N-acetyltransferase
MALAVTRLSATRRVIDMLSDMLVEVVAADGSVGFMHPLPPAAAHAFWQSAFEAVARKQRIILGATHGGTIIGTATLLLDLPPNQPHRAEIAKLMTRPAYRRQGVATALLRAAERVAMRHGRWLLVLDTAIEGGAAAFHERREYHVAGEIPDYALTPFGGLTGTRIYWKRLEASREPG